MTPKSQPAMLQKICFIGLLGLFPLISAPQALAQEPGPTIEQRLEKLTEVMEEQRIELHIPGMALAVVQGDQVIYSRGFGMADLENGKPVTPETLFAIGSTTKAFTASLVGMLVDEGKMSWDAPITDYLPYFVLPIDSDNADAQVIMRDVLAHRTGFTRMGVLWAGNAVSREEVLRAAMRAKPWTGFRKKFFYNNVTYLAAGEAAAAAAGMTWDALLQQRILNPLGMENTTSFAAVAKQDAHMSLGYQWMEMDQEFKQLPMRTLDIIGPAGSINSNVEDMAQWVRFQLGHGSFAGEELLSEEQHQMTWTKQMNMQPGVDYGMGWMLHQLGERRVVEHGGNIDGFAAEVGLFPESDLGFVLLTNVTATPLQQLSISLVADALLNEWPEESDAADGESYEPYLGNYLANFGAFKQEVFEVKMKSGKLAINVPGQTLYALEPPDEDGKRYFSLSDQIAISFDYDENGGVVGAKMYQGGMTFELPREGIVIAPEVDRSILEPLLGKYYSEKGDITFEVKISHHRLAVDVPGEMLYELRLPNDKDQWVFRVKDSLAVAFTRDAEGRGETLQMLRNGKVQGDFVRVAEQASPIYPTQAELLALRKAAGKLDVGSYRATGEIDMVHSGVKGRATRFSDGHGKSYTNTDFGKFGWIHQFYSAEQGWMDSSLNPFTELKGKYLLQARVMESLTTPGDWSSLLESVSVTGKSKRDGREVYAVALKAKDLPIIDGFVDVETGDLLRFRMKLYMPSLNITSQTVVYNQDFRLVDGIRVAHLVTSSDNFSGRTVMTLDTFETGVEVDPKLFERP